MVRKQNEAERFLEDADPRGWILPRILRADDSERHPELAVVALLTRTEIVATRKYCCSRIFGRSLTDTAGHHHHQRPVLLQNLSRKKRKEPGYRGFEECLHTLRFQGRTPYQAESRNN